MKRTSILFFMILQTILTLKIYSQENKIDFPVTSEKKYLIFVKGECANRDISEFYTWDESFIIDVVRKNFYSPVEYVLQYDIHKKHINDESGYYGPPLFWSLMKGNKEISELLLRNGADPNFITENGLSAYESIDEFVAKQFISQMKAYELKQMLQDFGYGNVNLDKYYINENHILRDSFELRTVELLSSSIVTTLQKGSSVKIKILGKYETIDGIKNRWVYIEKQENAKDRDGKELKTGTCGWCFGGYLE